MMMTKKHLINKNIHHLLHLDFGRKVLCTIIGIPMSMRTIRTCCDTDTDLGCSIQCWLHDLVGNSSNNSHSAEIPNRKLGCIHSDLTLYYSHLFTRLPHNLFHKSLHPRCIPTYSDIPHDSCFQPPLESMNNLEHT